MNNNVKECSQFYWSIMPLALSYSFLSLSGINPDVALANTIKCISFALINGMAAISIILIASVTKTKPF